jgi:uncharacterized protein (DUF342 family)
MSEVYESEFGNFVIETSDDKFTAFLTIKETEDFIDEKELLDLIAKASITHGFAQAQYLVETKQIKKIAGQPFPLACGDTPKPPEIEFSPLINTDKCYDMTMESHFTKLKSIQRVEKGEPLAHLFITKPSQIGTNIFGEEVVPESYDTQIINDYLGDNVSYSAERGQIIADKAGYPYMDELSRIHVKSEFIMDKNIDLTFPEGDFFGNLVVNGDVIDKVKLSIDGDLIVNGHIIDAEIEVTGDIFVSGDIKDCKSPGILAAGKISFNGAENSKITAGGTVSFTKSIHFCKVLAENGIFGNEETSSIVGGVCQSGEHVEVAIIGNTGSLATEVEISISPYTKEKMVNVSKQMLNLKEMGLTGNIEYIDLQDILSSLEATLEEKVNIIIKNIENLPKHILAYKKIFPGSYIRILKKSTHITTEHNKVSFSIVNGELTKDQY